MKLVVAVSGASGAPYAKRLLDFLAAEGPALELGQVRQRSGKIVHAWAVRGDADPAALRSNTFALEWPPRSGRRQNFPEVDRAEWFLLEVARQKINQGQRPLLDRLEATLR